MYYLAHLRSKEREACPGIAIKEHEGLEAAPHDRLVACHKYAPLTIFAYENDENDLRGNHLILNLIPDQNVIPKPPAQFYSNPNPDI